MLWEHERQASVSTALSSVLVLTKRHVGSGNEIAREGSGELCASVAKIWLCQLHSARSVQNQNGGLLFRLKAEQRAIIEAVDILLFQ